MAWQYYIHFGGNRLVQSEGGFPTEELALAAGWESANKLAASPANQQPGTPVYTVTADTADQEESSPH